MTYSDVRRCELRYRSLHQGRSLAFPCNEQGEVDLNELTDRQLQNYLLARALVGREFALPFVCVCDDGERRFTPQPR